MVTVKSPQPPVPDLNMTKQSDWNTRMLGPRLGTDMASALCASMLVAPVIALIDRSIVQRTTDPSSPLLNIFTANLRTALRKPLGFVTSAPFLIINVLYFTTYTTANMTDTAMSTVQNKPASTVTSGLPKFFSTGTINLGGSMYKDAQFAKMFGAGTAKAAGAAARASKPVPAATLAIFAVRDSMTIFASFNVPPVLGPMIGSLAAAQFIAPASVQFLSTPLHLLGLDLFNRPSKEVNLKWTDRFHVVRRDWLQASLGRVCRILPAYGFGGVVNLGVRRRLMERLE